MIEHVFRRAKLCAQLDDVYVATCDEEIRDVAEAFGAEAIMTSAAHERATDHVAESVEHFAADIVVMIQGAEPMIYQSEISPALDELQHFYQRPGWHQTLRKSANIDEDESAVLAETLTVIAGIRR